MHKRILAAVGALALVATIVAPSVAAAKQKYPRLPAPLAVDSKGDANGLAMFKRHNTNRRLWQVVGTVTAITGPVEDPKTDGSLTVKTSKGATYTFSFDSTSTTKYTTIIRKFKGTATWNEIMVGDTVHVYTTKLAKGKAVLIWDKGIFYTEARGTISNLNIEGKAFTLTVTIKNVEYQTTIKVDDATTYMLKDGTVKTLNDLANGQNVKVKGSWNIVGKYFLAKRIVIFPAI